MTRGEGGFKEEESEGKMKEENMVKWCKGEQGNVKEVKEVLMRRRVRGNERREYDEMV